MADSVHRFYSYCTHLMEFKMIAFVCVSKSENSAAEQRKKIELYNLHVPIPRQDDVHLSRGALQSHVDKF